MSFKTKPQGSISRLHWPSEPTATRLCLKCGDSIRFTLFLNDFQEIVQHVRSGLRVTSLQRCRYEDSLDDAQGYIDQYQKEITRLRDAMHSIEEQQKFLTAYADGLEHLLAPINRLSEDILVEIFKYVCCEDAGANYIDYTVWRKPLPTLTLRGVCSRWFRFIGNTPVLWSCFGIRCVARNRDNLGPSFSSFLTRSQFHPIDFKIELRLGTAKQLGLLLNMETTRRWRVAVFAGVAHGFSEYVLRELVNSKLDLPELVKLDIDTGSQTETIKFLIKCPKLRILHLRGFFLRLLYDRPSTHLVMHELSFVSVLDILGYCPNVQDVTVTHLRTFDFMSAHVKPEMARVCNAKSLSIDFGIHSLDGYGATGLDNFLKSITMPRLTRLAILDTFLNNENFVEPLRDMLERSMCSVTHVRIRGAQFNKDRMHRLFDSCLSLVTNMEFEETGDAAYECFFDGLTAHHQEKDTAKNSTSGCNAEVGGSASTGVTQTQVEGDSAPSTNNGAEVGVKAAVAPTQEDQSSPSFLPNLTDLSLIIIPQTEMVLKLIRARWKPATDLTTADRSSELSCIEVDDSDTGDEVVDMDCGEDSGNVDKEQEARKWHSIYMSLTGQTQSVVRAVDPGTTTKDGGDSGGTGKLSVAHGVPSIETSATEANAAATSDPPEPNSDSSSDSLRGSNIVSLSKLWIHCIDTKHPSNREEAKKLIKSCEQYKASGMNVLVTHPDLYSD
ncbi:hypothetical protein F5877DRAFT_80335 [Lentinula edodes]|nr:hypothetical protein F5877DRAFT_80335 [Lentinula edodes]